MGSIIAIWSGPVSAIPPGWVLCDGQNGTPDLRGEFVRGAYSDALRPPRSTGGGPHTHSIGSGGASHTHTTDLAGGHTHSAKAYNYPMPSSYYGPDYISHTHNTGSGGASHVHTSGAAEAVPPYYDVAYIMALDPNYDLPKGAIVMWTGAISEIPPGWVFCDGQNGTPDLRDRFLVGAVASRNRGGSETHSHALVNNGAHTHTSGSAVGFANHEHPYMGEAVSGGFCYSSGNYNWVGPGGSSHTHMLQSAGGHTHSVGDGSNLPSYYALAFIMRKE